MPIKSSAPCERWRLGSLRRIERHVTFLITTTKQSWRSCSLRNGPRAKPCVIELISEGMTSAFCSFSHHAVFSMSLFPLITSSSYFSTHISLSLSPLPLLSSPLSRFSPLAKSVLAFPHSLRNAKTHNPLPRRNLGIRRPRCPKHSLQCSSPVSNDCSSRHLLLRPSHRPNSLLPTWGRYRADE